VALAVSGLVQLKAWGVGVLSALIMVITLSPKIVASFSSTKPSESRGSRPPASTALCSTLRAVYLS
jgi:hypothetical protein